MLELHTGGCESDAEASRTVYMHIVYPELVAQHQKAQILASLGIHYRQISVLRSIWWIMTLIFCPHVFGPVSVSYEKDDDGTKTGIKIVHSGTQSVGKAPLANQPLSFKAGRKENSPVQWKNQTLYLVRAEYLHQDLSWMDLRMLP